MTEKFTWESTYDANAGDAVMFIRNTSDGKVLMITSVFLGSVANNRFHISRVTGNAQGTLIQGQNRSGLASNQTPGDDARSYGNAVVTDIAPQGVMGRRRIRANTSRELEFGKQDKQDFILGPGDAVAVYADVSGIMEVTIMGEFA